MTSGKTSPNIRLDSIVTVVDADAMARFPSLGHTGREQIELADIIIINKADLVAEDALDQVRQAVKIAEWPRIDWRLSGAGWIRLRFSESCAMRPHQSTRRTRFLSGISIIHPTRQLDHASLIRVLETLPSGIYRAKGFARTEKGGFLVNYVAGRFEFEEHACSRTGLVFIGKDAGRFEEGIVRSLESASAT